MRISRFGFGLLVFVSAQALAGEAGIYKTRTGQSFAGVANDRFGVAWQAPDGSIWSQFQGVFSNQGKLGTEITAKGDQAVLNSPATEACARIGGELPSIEQFQTLASYFADTADFRGLFPFPDSANLFWTVNGRPGFARFARLSPVLDPYGDFATEEKQLSVMCRHAASK